MKKYSKKANLKNGVYVLCHENIVFNIKREEKWSGRNHFLTICDKITIIDRNFNRDQHIDFGRNSYF